MTAVTATGTPEGATRATGGPAGLVVVMPGRVVEGCLARVVLVVTSDGSGVVVVSEKPAGPEQVATATSSTRVRVRRRIGRYWHVPVSIARAYPVDHVRPVEWCTHRPGYCGRDRGVGLSFPRLRECGGHSRRRHRHPRVGLALPLSEPRADSYRLISLDSANPVHTSGPPCAGAGARAQQVAAHATWCAQAGRRRCPCDWRTAQPCAHGPTGKRVGVHRVVLISRAPRRSHHPRSLRATSVHRADDQGRSRVAR